MKKIEIDLLSACFGRGGSMRNEFNVGTENYIPMIRGIPLQEEGGITVNSYNNLQEVISSYGRPYKVEAGPNGGILFSFGSSIQPTAYYLSTGFSLGYRGEGPTGLARILETCGYGTLEQLRSKIAALDAEYEGDILAELP